ncbi:hypothetical protein CLIB1423_29S00232 [[Candida] railenensis]|uniref:Methyltransferase type 11 domain-containing protein n=1 Tax=[Candida] railenensis TaxID=45579 RepID=A0A9P0QV39_9ASCO|nr:hypothetical protein CLIB1423_29S00232 [[Candida] railenensis]
MIETDSISYLPISLSNFFGILVVGILTYAAFADENVKGIFIFAYNCFFKPFGKKSKSGDQQEDLESFYKNQASIYDQTRKILLKGRENALQLAVTHLLASHPTGKDLVWIDIGGGTGSNLEFMKNVYKINRKNFRKIYMIDYSSSLCEQAKKKFSKEIELGVVEILCSDASKFEIQGLNRGGVDLFTFSYSLSMIPNYYSTVDHIIPFLNREHGIVCSIDFGTQSDYNAVGRVDTLGGLVNRNGSWLTRHFWNIWFEFDKVHLDAARRNYLEYKFGTLKSLNLRNKTLGNIPYYIWIGCDKFKCANLIDKINAYVTESPYLLPQGVDSLSNSKLRKGSFASISSNVSAVSKGHEAAIENQKRGLPYPSVYYQKDVTRVYYDELNPLFEQFNNQYIYAFTWEDPREDMNILNINSNDSILAITSAGDNLLHYATLPNPPKKIHGVDLNPCQNHLLELKLACFKAKLDQEKIWQIFGEGKLETKEEFLQLLLSQLSPHLSSNALQYWVDKGPRTFSPKGNGLYYDTGSTRWALKLARWLFVRSRLTSAVDQLCNSKTMKEQKGIWESKIKPTLFNPIIGKLLIGNSVFLWKALGVPINQANMIQGSILNYIIDTLDPIVERSLLSTDNYFYYLCLQAKYAKNNCPSYLTSEGYHQLTKKNSPIPNFRLHTDTLNDVLKRLSSQSLTIIVIMDHMDWFDPQGQEAEEEIQLLNNALSENGRVMLRSASTEPWYIAIFNANGFISEPVAVRESGNSIDRCNMYASTWVCTKRSPLRSFSTSSDATISSLKL